MKNERVNKISIVFPAKNESLSHHTLIRKIQEFYPEAEILLIDDSSDDKTGLLALDQASASSTTTTRVSCSPTRAGLSTISVLPIFG